MVVRAGDAIELPHVNFDEKERIHRALLPYFNGQTSSSGVRQGAELEISSNGSTHVGTSVSRKQLKILYVQCHVTFSASDGMRRTMLCYEYARKPNYPYNFNESALGSAPQRKAKRLNFVTIESYSCLSPF